MRLSIFDVYATMLVGIIGRREPEGSLPPEGVPPSRGPHPARRWTAGSRIRDDLLR